jgi:hypothetical protein
MKNDGFSASACPEWLHAGFGAQTDERAGLNVIK